MTFNFNQSLEDVYIQYIYNSKTNLHSDDGRTLNINCAKTICDCFFKFLFVKVCKFSQIGDGYIHQLYIYIYCCHASIFLSTSFLLAEVDSGAPELAGLPTQSSGTTVKVCGIGRP